MLRKGWLRRAVTVGAALSVASPAFAAGQVETSYVQQVVAFVKSFFEEAEVEEAKEVDLDRPEHVMDTGLPEVDVPPVRKLGGRPRPNPSYLQKLKVNQGK